MVDFRTRREDVLMVCGMGMGGGSRQARKAVITKDYTTSSTPLS